MFRDHKLGKLLGKNRKNGHDQEDQMEYVENTHDAVTSLAMKLNIPEEKAIELLFLSELRRINQRLDWIHQDVGISADIAKEQKEAKQ